MKPTLLSALQNVSAKISDLLVTDPFPNTVYPECLQKAVRSYPARGGKRLRPALLLWACQALGGTEQEALYAAAATEVFHSWTLVHDDIIDEDELRRGQPTAHMELASHARSAYRQTEHLNQKFGRDFAILAGDIQQAWAADLLMRSVECGCPAELVFALVRRLHETVNRELISGEALDVELPMRDWSQVSSKDILQVIDGKTVCLLKFSVQTGGMIALRTPELSDYRLTALGSYADGMGTAFQLRDDYLGIFGDLKTFGKPLCSDFQEGKPTLICLYAMNTLPAAGREKLLSLIGLPEYPDPIVAQIRQLLTECGADKYLQQEITRYTNQAINSLHSLPDNPYRQLLLDLADYLLDRDI